MLYYNQDPPKKKKKKYRYSFRPLLYQQDHVAS